MRHMPPLVPFLPKHHLLSVLYIATAAHSMTLSRTITKERLLQKATVLRSSSSSHLLVQKSYPPPMQELFYDSAYPQARTKRNRNRESNLRGFCNWLIPHHVMIGQYPACTPERNGCLSHAHAQQHIYSLLHTAKIRTFCSLQSELPSQVNFKAWEEANGRIFLDKSARTDFPHSFLHYEPLVQEALQQLQQQQEGTKSIFQENDEVPIVSFLHAPILDLSTPSSSSLYTLLSTLLDTILDSNPPSNPPTTTTHPDDGGGGGAIYIHCWGGRGRAGLVGACLLSLLYPELDANICLEWVQRGYDTRLGAKRMPVGLQTSPQTMAQQEFVREFVRDLRS